MSVSDEKEPMPTADSDEALMARMRRGEAILNLIYYRKRIETEMIAGTLAAEGIIQRSNSYRRTAKAQWFARDIALALNRLEYEGLVERVELKIYTWAEGTANWVWMLTFEGWVHVAGNLAAQAVD